MHRLTRKSFLQFILAAPGSAFSKQFIGCALCLITCASLPAQVKNSPAIEEHYKKGSEALEARQYAVAAEEFRDILRIDPTNASAHANLGEIAFAEKDYAQASQEFRAALKLQPSLWNAEALLGMSEFLRGNHAQAQPLLEASFNHLDDARLKSEVGLDIITLCYQSNNLDPCVDVLRALLQIRPVAPETLYTAYRLYSDLAARSLSHLVQTAPDSAEVHEVLAQSLASHDDFPGAIAQYCKALEIAPDVPGIHFELGRMILANSQTPAALQEAEQQFDLCLKGDPANANSLYMLGEIKWLQSKPEDALKYYLRSLKIQPNSVDARIAAGKTLTALGRPTEALTQLVEAVRLDPRNEVAHYRLAQAYRKLDRASDADREEAAFRRLRDEHGSARALGQQVIEQSVMPQTAQTAPR
ncbi:MAG TPA: tetratricopeptide repeat protein [Terriglobia bacterium]|nr:tetratricopeptide repeat protein [Terriglobia bacterium]